MRIGTVAVFCGSSSGNDPSFVTATKAFALELAERRVSVVYGGGSVGLMGILADTALRADVEVTGVITRALVDKEVEHAGLSTLEVVETMHERKQRMADLSDAFVMLPGGFGTLEEFCEALTGTQLGLQAKPCALLDVVGYFADFLAFLDHAVAAGFLREENRDLVSAHTDASALLDALDAWRPSEVEKWVDPAPRLRAP